MRTTAETIPSSLSYEQLTEFIARMPLTERKRILFFMQTTLYDNEINPRSQWEKDAIEMRRLGDDEPIFSDSFEDENLNWWTWK
jgi:hypothetical protein